MDMSEGAVRTQRPPSYAQMLVSSTDRYSNPIVRLTYPTTSSNWSLNLKNYALNGYFTRLALTQLQVFWNIPTIIDGVNDVFILNIDGTETPFTLTAGFYSGSELATEIENEVSATIGTFTCTYNDDGGFRFDSGGPEQISFALLDNDVPDYNSNNNFLFTIGAIEPNFTAQTNTAFSTGVAPMLYTRWIDLCSSYLTKYQRAKDQTSDPAAVVSNVIARIYPTPPNVTLNQAMPGQLYARPFVMCIDYNTPKMIMWNKDEAISNFDLQLRDEYGNFLPWSPEFGTEYQLTILASET